MDSGYRLSQFVLIVPDARGNLLAKNTLTGRIVRLAPNHQKLLNSLPDLPPEEYPLWERDRDILNSGGVVCEMQKNENKEFLRWMDERRMPSVFVTFLATTLGCNLACSYCYERDILNTQRMDEKLYPLVLKWYERRMRSGRFERVAVSLYGGEPLADQRGLQYFMPALHNLGEMLGVPVEFDMISNGVLLTKEVVELLMQFRFKSAQITLDGPPRIHDSSRLAIGGQPTFWKIVENTELLFPFPCQVSLRVNLSQNNAGHLEELLSFLKKRGWHEKVSFSFGIIQDNLLASRLIQTICSGCIHDDSEAARVYVEAVKTAKKLGYAIVEESTVGPCMTSIGDAFVVGPDGSLYKCMEVIGRKEFIVGSVISDVPTQEQLRYENPDYLGRCFDEKCVFLPVCAGGCRAEAFRESGDSFERHCRYSFLEETNTKLIQIQYHR